MSTERSSTRETMFALFLVGLFAVAVAVLLYVLSLGAFGYVFGGAALFAVVAFLHYVAWGHAMSQEVAGEQEELQVRENMQSEAIRDPYRKRPS